MQSIIQPHSHQLQGKRAPWTAEEIAQYLSEHQVVLFARGTRARPRCGYTARIIDWLESAGVSYDCLDVATDKSIIPAMIALYGRCSFPLVVVGSKLIPTFDELEHSDEILLASNATILGDADSMLRVAND